MYIIHRIQIYALQLCMECYLLEKSLLVVFQITAYGNLLALYWLTFYKLKCVFSQKSGCWWSCWVSAWQDILRLSGESINTNVGTVQRHYKVEKILKGSLDSIPSPSTSVKIQIMDAKVCLRWKGKKTLLGVFKKLSKTKSLLKSPSNVLPYYIKQTFLSMIWIFHWRWLDQIQAIFINLFYFTYKCT